MSEPLTWVALASFGLVALSIALLAGLKGWQGWLDLKRLEMKSGRAAPSAPSPAARIEVADLKERIRNPFAHGGTENDRGSIYCHIPGVVNNAVFLLIGGIMFLIGDNNA